VLAAALLHDCGKTVSGLGTYGRVIATLSVKLAGTEQALAWRETRGFTVVSVCTCSIPSSVPTSSV
jgi:hypothetical protein